MQPAHTSAHDQCLIPPGDDSDPSGERLQARGHGREHLIATACHYLIHTDASASGPRRPPPWFAAEASPIPARSHGRNDHPRCRNASTCRWGHNALFPVEHGSGRHVIRAAAQSRPAFELLDRNSGGAARASGDSCSYTTGINRLDTPTRQVKGLKGRSRVTPSAPGAVGA